MRDDECERVLLSVHRALPESLQGFVKVHGNRNRSEGPEGVNKERGPDDADLQSIEIFGPTDRPL
jgi:hypothetical protein